MENKQPTTGKFALRYGLLLGAVSVTFGIMLYLTDMHYQQEISTLVISIAIMLAVILIALFQFKKANDGYMTFGEALKIGIGLCLIGGVISMLFQLLLSNVIDPGMVDKQMEIAKAKMVDYGMTQEQIESQLEISKKMSGPFIQAAFGLIFSIFLGFVLTLIPALVMKKTKSEL
ncbi:DUF4199 domain-containing protein [Joostella atrarenae]|uniref:DUF4199 domain-containing protein n=1 Tax=Joostella atrarenae TaxID=679257 RepID=A0ABS9J459_9FLAO|nr:DUF4199 domain-containing protein [Joostella atrarenae]MCF8715217.1 DUF4199 domain-containing protein [Joostella atrarenae]